MYDALSADYDRFVNWHGRLAVELPFIIDKLHEAGAKQVLDAATGTGMHAIALAQCGFSATGADISEGMVKRASVNAASAGVRVRFEKAALGRLSPLFGKGSFDALLCLGNSLPHLLSLNELDCTMLDFANCLRPGGLLLLQNRNYDAIMAQHERWMEPQSHTEGATEWLFLRFYDFDADGLITFNMIILKREDKSNWSQSISTSRLRPLLKGELISILGAAGFRDIKTYGNMAGAPFDSDKSSNLVITARNPGKS